MTSAEHSPLVEGEDFYREGAMVVFTERFHLRRGYCCGSGCRHCPYDGEDKATAATKREDVDAAEK